MENADAAGFDPARRGATWTYITMISRSELR